MYRAMNDAISMYEKNPSDFSIREYGDDEKQRILDYMRSFSPFAAAGIVYDCVSGERTTQENVGFTDGVFYWTSQDIYHIEKYGASVSNEFYSRFFE